MRKYVKGCCVMSAYYRMPNGLREKAFIKVTAIFRCSLSHHAAVLEAANKIYFLIRDRYGIPAELGNLGLWEIAKDIIDFYPDCAECEAEIVGIKGGKSNPWLSEASVMTKRPKWRWPRAW